MSNPLTTDKDGHRPDLRKVFVIHGRNDAAREASSPLG
jgi:hypothetical protein